MTDLLRHPRDWTPGQAYRDPDGNGTWVVEAFYGGTVVIHAAGTSSKRSEGGVLHFANRELGEREIIFADDPKLDKLVRISA